MKRAVQLSSLSLFALLLALGAANADPQASEPRSVPAFQSIELAGTLEVDVTVGKAQTVQVSGEADLLAKVTTVVKDGVLVVDTERNMKRRHHLHVSVTVPALASVALSGTGEMKIAGIANQSFAMSLPGTGELSVTGSTSSLRVVVDGTGQISAKDLAARSAKVEVNGTGSATLRVTESLEANVTGTGSIDVHGKPARVKKSVSGVGSIHIR
jgi:hypothetical protein